MPKSVTFNLTPQVQTENNLGNSKDWVKTIYKVISINKLVNNNIRQILLHQGMLTPITSGSGIQFKIPKLPMHSQGMIQQLPEHLAEHHSRLINNILDLHEAPMRSEPNQLSQKRKHDEIS